MKMMRLRHGPLVAVSRLSVVARRAASAPIPASIGLSSPSCCVACGAAAGRFHDAPSALNSARLPPPSPRAVLLRRFSSSAARHPPSHPIPPADDEPFDVLADRAWRALSGVHDAVTARHSRETLRTLRAEAARPDLWDGDAAHAARVVQQLAALEAREAKAAELRRAFLDARELFALARDEGDAAVTRECQEAMAQVLADAQQMRVQLLLQPAGSDEDGDASSDNAAPCLVEIQAGAGGQDSCDWVAMLARMYARWGHARAFDVQTVDESPGVDGVGLRAVILRLDGAFAYGWARAEAGVHRLVRLSPFDSARRRHTSFAQVRVYPVSVGASAAAAKKSGRAEIPAKDLRVDSFRSSGAGGQHVNTTDSAVRVTHLPTGIVVQCQAERSQHRNKASAMEVLHAKLRQRELEARAKHKRQYAMGLGDNAWGSQIRSYVLHPYTLVKDHRTNYTETNVERVLDGGVDRFMEEMLLAQSKSADGDDEDAAAN